MLIRVYGNGNKQIGLLSAFPLIIGEAIILQSQSMSYIAGHAL